jgi:hypothetical protein
METLAVGQNDGWWGGGWGLARLLNARRELRRWQQRDGVGAAAR